MKKIDRLSVFFDDGTEKRLVGTLALYKNRFAAFSYSDEWISTGFSISPFSLPLEKRVFLPEWEPFGGLHGIFNDSLPDGWGRLLVDRLLLREGISPSELSVLDRLAIVGSGGMGALTYEPETFLQDAPSLPADYDSISAECERILNSELSENDKENLDAIFAAGGSSGGARPKVFAKIDGEDWIVKFPSSVDSKEIGLQEYEYNLCAKKCGIELNDFRLFPSKKCAGYFGTKRFDRNYLGKGRVLMASASALLETSHRIPNLDYNTLCLLTLKLTKNNAEIEKLFRLMCFNVFSHNRDDHSKNFSWLYDENKSQWILSPAYDLTYSNSIGGEHATTIDGEGKNPTMENILEVAKKNGIKPAKAAEIAESVKNIVKNLSHGFGKI
ncbi:MAG: type II toxin-antitoxin system HipA family toxin [Treponema sp.]|nr:type II toxin-antitoxin system HipA family toxin [Treponema sp.]